MAGSSTIRVEKVRKVWTRAAVDWLKAQVDMVKRTPNIPHTIVLKSTGRLAPEDVRGYLQGEGILVNIGKDSDRVYACYEKKEKKGE